LVQGWGWVGGGEWDSCARRTSRVTTQEDEDGRLEPKKSAICFGGKKSQMKKGSSPQRDEDGSLEHEQNKAQKFARVSSGGGAWKHIPPKKVSSHKETKRAVLKPNFILKSLTWKM